MRRASLQIVHLKARAAVFAREHNEMMPEEGRVGDEAAVVMRNDVAPVLFARSLSEARRRS